jgi:hypothetical protein
MRNISSLVVAAAIVTASVGVGAQSKEFLPLTPMDRIQIQQLIARYAFALDTGGRNGYDYADLFTADGLFVGMNQGATGRAYRGRDSLAALARGGSRNQNYVSHYITNVVLEATPDGARGTQYAIIGDVSEPSGKSAWTHGGHYEDTYVKTPDGWRFKTRVFYASEGGPTPKQLQNDPLKAPVAPAAAPGTPAPPPVPKATGVRILSAEDYISLRARHRREQRLHLRRQLFRGRRVHPAADEGARQSGEARNRPAACPELRPALPDQHRDRADGRRCRRPAVSRRDRSRRGGAAQHHFPGRSLRGRLREDGRRLEVQAPGVHSVAEGHTVEGGPLDCPAET